MRYISCTFFHQNHNFTEPGRVSNQAMLTQVNNSFDSGATIAEGL